MHVHPYGQCSRSPGQCLHMCRSETVLDVTVSTLYMPQDHALFRGLSVWPTLESGAALTMQTVHIECLARLFAVIQLAFVSACRHCHGESNQYIACCTDNSLKCMSRIGVINRCHQGLSPSRKHTFVLISNFSNTFKFVVSNCASLADTKSGLITH